MDWVTSFSNASKENPPPLLDIRPQSSFSKGHVHGATHFEGIEGPDGVLSRLNELPAPSQSLRLAILALTPEQAQEAAMGLQARGHRAPIILTEALLRTLPGNTGPESRPLWSPAPVLAEELPRVLATVGTERTALDVGSGSGRDSAYLTARGFRVTAVDRDAALLAMAERFANREAKEGGSADTVLRTLGAHLQKDRAWLRRNRSKLLLVVRFFRRGVLELLHEGVEEGGFVIYEHFLKGCEKFGGPKKDSQMLLRGELRKVFSEKRGFQVLRDSEETLADGRPVTRFVAYLTRRDNVG